MIKLSYKVFKISELTADDQTELFELFQKYYKDVRFSMFLRDLQEKTHILILVDRSRQNIQSRSWGRSRLAGFSTILSKANVFFSGDTVIHEDYWGSKVLQNAFFYFIYRYKLLHPFQKKYWLLISKAFKTYLLLKNNFDSSFPAYDRETPK